MLRRSKKSGTKRDKARRSGTKRDEAGRSEKKLGGGREARDRKIKAKQNNTLKLTVRIAFSNCFARNRTPDKLFPRSPGPWLNADRGCSRHSRSIVWDCWISMRRAKGEDEGEGFRRTDRGEKIVIRATRYPGDPALPSSLRELTDWSIEPMKRRLRSLEGNSIGADAYLPGRIRRLCSR